MNGFLRVTSARLPAVGLLALLLWAIPGLAPVAAQEGGIRCTTTSAQELLTTGQSVFFSAEPRSTENGGAIYFWSTGDLEQNGGNSDGNIELFRSQLIFNADGTVTRTFRQITRSTGSILGGFNLAPDVSADGRYLTFFSDRHYPGSGFDNRDGNFEIFVADVSDLNNVIIRQITNTTQGSNLYPSISNDGMRIAFISDNPLDPATANTVADELRNLDIYLADLSGPAPVFRQITQTPLGVLNEAPSLSGDGSTLVFASGQSYVDPSSGATVNPEGNQEIFRFVAATGVMSALTNTAGGVQEMPSVSGDGSRVAFVSDQRLDPNVNIVGGRQIFLHPNPATASGFLQVSNTVGADNFAPNISADGNRIIYQRSDSVGQQVVLYDGIAGSRQVFRSRTNPTTGELGQPILSGNGTVLFYEDEGGISVVECSISDLGLTASVSPSSVVAGSGITYVWTVSNLDQAVAGDVQVQATLPAGITASSTAPPGLCSQSGQTLTCTINRLEIGQSRTMTVTGAVAADALGSLTTPVNASSLKTVDRNPANNSASLTTHVTAHADLGIVKRALPDTALNGEEITYTLSVSNTGPSLARNVRVTDTLPFGVTFLSSPNCVLAGGEVRCALGNMPPGSAFTGTVRTRVTTFEELDIVNVAQVGGEQITDPAPLNNSVAITNSVNTKFDLEVTASAEPAQLVAGDVVTYTYRITNFGPSVADNVELSVTLPAELSAIGQPQPPGGGSCTAGPVFTCDLGSLPRTQAATVPVTGTVSATVSSPVLSLASVRSTTEANADRNPANDNANVSRSVVQRADLSVAKSASAPGFTGAVVAGATLTYTLSVINNGPSVATGTILTDILPSGVALSGLATSLGSCSGSAIVSCALGALLPGQNATVTATVLVNVSALGSLTNTVSASSAVLDPDPANNSASAITSATDRADLRLVKSASVTAAVSGQDSFFYTLAVGNGGPSLARSVKVTETLASGLTFTGFGGPTGTSCTALGGGVVGCSLPNSSPGVTQTLRIDVAASAGATGVLTSSAVAATSALDPDPANNSASVAITSGQSADIQVTKRAVIANLNVGGLVTYTVTVDNFGPSNASGVVISDVLPGAFSGPAVVASQGSYSLTSSLWTVGDIAAGQKVTLTVAGSIGAAASGLVITNTAQLHALDQTDPQLVNNGQFVTFTVPLNAEVALGHSLSSQTPPVQSIVTIVLTATNNGPETATNVQVLDSLPSALSYVSQVAGSGSYSPTSGVWTVGSLASGTSTALTISARVIGSGHFTNTATLSAAEYDNNPANNVSALGLTVAPAADLVLTQTVQPTAPNVGDTLHFTLTISNQGPDTASGVQVQSLAPGSAGVVPSAGTSYSATTSLWTIPVLASGDVATLIITRTVSASGPITATAQVMASSLFDPDSTPANGVGNGEDDQVSVTLTAPPAADLGLHMSASGGEFVGQDVLLQIQVTNHGPDLATNIAISESLPANLTYSTHVVVGSGSYNPATKLWTIPSLGVGSFTILNITARVAASAAGQTVTDQVESVVLDQYDPGKFSNAASVSFLVGGADLAVSKVVNPATADVGGQVVYTVTVVNNGPTATSSVRITDSLPISLTGILATASSGTFGPSTPGAQGVWLIPSLAVNASHSLVLTGTVIPGTANQLITNTISGASSDVADGNTTNNGAAVSFRATAADLVLQKTATVTQPVEGQSFFYFLNITNSGPDLATNVVVTDTVAQGITVTVAGSGYNLGTGRWDVGSLTVGQSKSLLLTVHPLVGVSGGLVVVDPIDAVSARQEDPVPAINASVTITVTGADMLLTKSASNTTPDAGAIIGFSLGLTNTGPLPAGQVVVTDALPVGLTVVGTPAVTAGSVQVDGPNRLITWTHTSLAVGASAQMEMTTTVSATSGGQSLVNRAGIASVQGESGGTLADANKANHTPSVTVLPQTGDLTVGIVASPNPVNAGAPLLYTTTVTNSGPTAVANFTLTNTLPAGVTVQSASPGCTVTFPTVVCVRSSALGVNATQSYTIVVTSSVLTTLVHTAVVSTATPESSTANNSASQSTTVDPASAIRLVLTGASSQSAGVAQNLTITAKDSFGNTASGYSGDKSLTFSGAANAPNGTSPSVTDKTGVARNFGVATSINFVNGVATVSGGANGVLSLVKVETAVVSVTDGTISTSGGDRLTVTVSAGAAAKLILTGSGSQTAGASQNLTIAAQDSFGNPALTYSGDKTLSFSGAANAPSGTSPAVVDKNGTSRTFGVATTISFVNGTATVSGGNNGVMTLVKVETATVAVSDTVSAIGSSGSDNLSVTVSAAPAHNLTFSTQPSANGTAAVNLPQQPAVQIRDQFNNPTSATDSISLGAFSDSICTAGAGGTLNGTGPVAAVSGVATFSGVNYNLAGTIYLKATDTTNGAVLAACSSAVTIAHGAASQLSISVQPGTAGINQALNPAPQVRVLDAHGNTVSSDSTSSINATIITGTGTFVSSDTQVQLASGVATFSNLRFNATGTYNLRFSINTASFTVDSNAFTISAGSASKLRITGSATQTAGNTQSLTITALDAANNTATNYTGLKSLTFSFESGSVTAPDGVTSSTVTDNSGAAQIIGTSTSISFTNGVATINGSANGVLRLVRTGAFVLQVTDGTVSATGSDRLTVNVSPGAAHNLIFSQQPGGTATAGVNFSPQPAVQIRDQFHNPTTDTDTIVLTPFTDGGCTAAGGGTLNGGGGTAASAGVATFTAVNYTKAETVHLKASSGSLATACSSGVAVAPASAAKLVIGGSATQTAGISQSLTITAQDSFGNTATTYAGAKSLTFGGAASAPNSTMPTVTNSSGVQINFGSVTSINFSSGVATASGGSNGAMTLVKAETATVAVTDTVASITSNPSGNLTVTVSGAGPHNLIFNQQPAPNATAGQPLNPQPILHIRDQFHNLSPVTDTVTLAAFSGAGCTSAPNGTLSGGSVAAAGGVATFTAVSYTKAELISLQASDSTTGGVATACSNTTNLAADVASKYVVEVVDTPTAGQDVTVNARLSDANGNAVSTSGKTVNWSSTGGGIFASATSLTNGSGVATVEFTTNKAADISHTVVATDTDTFTGTSPVFTTVPGAFVKLQLLVPGETAVPGSGSGKSGTPSGQSVSIPFTVTVNGVDAYWNRVTSAADTIAISSSDGSAILPANAALVNGTRVFTVTLKTPGSHSLTASETPDTGKADSTVPAIAVTRAFTITKTAYPNPVVAGQQITYTVLITKSALAAGANVRLTDTLPVTVTGIVSSTAGGLSCSGTGPVVCTLASLSANASAALTVTGTVSSTALHNEQLVNLAQVSADGMTAAESAQVTTTVNTLADLSITKSENLSGTVVGAVITYTLRITNTGPSYARSVYITDTLPLSVSFGSVVAVTPTNLFGGESVSGVLVTWMTDTLPVIHSGYITFTGTITGTGTLTNSVSISSTTTDSAPGNNSATTAGFTVAGALMATSVSDLWVAGDGGGESIGLGTTGPILLRVGNRGPATEGQPLLTISGLPAGAVEVRTSPPVTCPRQGDGTVCALPPLAPGDGVEIAVTLPTDAPARWESVWQVVGERFDPNPDNNRLTRRWVVGESLWRFFLPLLDNQVDAERNRPEENELFLPEVVNP